MLKVRLRIISYIAGGLYLGFSSFIFFFTLGSAGHTYWPLPLYFLIWPLSLVGLEVDEACINWLVSNPAPSWVVELNDYIMGAYFIILGTLWFWFLGRLISLLITRLFPIKPDMNN